ncbi:hypothetical protein [Fuscibacter oryzae]|uniref:Uncharacterized protein n=1 Tax=Fuscibacter oryzae TaxID=2803939 RepID=A0A8J7MPE0_9RHOB|nr:hypothetical protein [Fuscibacter oryzae]MBL4927543.1 hypothetical protein [Fuscibacter oryzae]
MFWKKKPAEPVKRIENPALIAVFDRSKTLTVNVFPTEIKTPAIAGIMLADIAVHMSKALVAAGLAVSEASALSVIVEIFNAERANPTDVAVGGLVQ